MSDITSPETPRRSQRLRKSTAEASSSSSSSSAAAATGSKRRKASKSDAAVANGHATGSAAAAAAPAAPAAHGAEAPPIEFGGAVGAAALMIWSHCVLYYFWYCWQHNGGVPLVPTGVADLTAKAQAVTTAIVEEALPTWDILLKYCLFIGLQVIFASFMPGMWMLGRDIGKGVKLQYLCNGYACYYLSVALLAVAHFTGVFKLTEIYDNFAKYLTASILMGDGMSLFWYVFAFATKQTTRMSGNPIYDFFMGAILYPRVLGIVDIKMVAECRWSWLTLFTLTSSAALHQYEETKSLSPSMIFLVFAHWLYSNATVKGEQYIPATWDMFYEKFGWMLCFWNVAGVPFLYCFQSLYVAKYNPQVPTPWLVVAWIMLLVGYYVFDIANAQKSSFKLGPILRPWVFPNLPGAVLTNPKTLKTPYGNLLIDGCYAYARKCQYTGDILMAISWGLVCGFGSFLPYFYATFFVGMIVHRQTRDEYRCSKKYGKYWEEYKKTVPAIFIPGVV